MKTYWVCQKCGTKFLTIEECIEHENKCRGCGICHKCGKAIDNQYWKLDRYEICQSCMKKFFSTFKYKEGKI